MVIQKELNKKKMIDMESRKKNGMTEHVKKKNDEKEMEIQNLKKWRTDLEMQCKEN